VIRAHKTRIKSDGRAGGVFPQGLRDSALCIQLRVAEWKRHKAQDQDMPFGPMAIKKSSMPSSVTLSVGSGSCQRRRRKRLLSTGCGAGQLSASQKGKRKGKEVGFPKFKSKHSRKQAFHLNNGKVKARDHELYVPCLGWVNVAETLRSAERS